MKAIAKSGFNILKLFNGCIQNWVYYSQEPRITCHKNRQPRDGRCSRLDSLSPSKNHCYFRVYDPVSNWSGSFNSEAEVRVWLEARYYQLPNNY